MRAPDRLFVVTVGAQWAVTVAVALAASRTGSLFGEVVVAQAWVDHAAAVADGSLVPTGGPLYALLLTPITLLTTRVETVASIVTAVNVIVLAPLATYCLLEVGRRIAGRAFAIAATATWLLGPLVVIPLFVPKYHDTYVNDVLPVLYGLTVGPAFVAMVLSLAAAMFAMRAVADAPRAGFAAGLLAAAAIGLLPVGAGIAAGVLCALAIARRWRQAGEALIGLAAGLVPTLIWRQRALEDAMISTGHPTWVGFQQSMANVREYFYSNRLLQWLPVAGAIGMARLRSPAAGLTAAWVAVAAIVAVATPAAFDGGRFFVNLVPAWPAYALLVAAIPALVPTLVARFRDRIGSEPEAPAVSRALAAILGGVVVVLAGLLAALVAR